MNSYDLISVIIPVYKVEKYLDRCVNSVINQTYKNLEIILVDDDSPDNCPRLCDEWAKKDSRIKVFHIENKGVSNARNIGMENATGDYIGFVDSDDYIEKDMFESLINDMADTSCEISVCGYQINDGISEDDKDNIVKSVSQTEALRLIAQGDYKYGVIWNKLYKASLIKDIKMPPLVCCEDLVFNYYAFKKALHIVESDKKKYHYMQNQDSVTKGNFGIGAFDAVRSKEIILNSEKGTELEPYAVRGLISSCFVVLSGVIQSNLCLDKYDYLRDIIVSHKNEILRSPMYTKLDKIKTILLFLSKKLYNKLIGKKYSSFR